MHSGAQLALNVELVDEWVPVGWVPCTFRCPSPRPLPRSFQRMPHHACCVGLCHPAAHVLALLLWMGHVFCVCMLQALKQQVVA